MLAFMTTVITAQTNPFHTGADLSYLNTLQNSGAQYFDPTGNPVNAYNYFAQRGANLTRLRLFTTWVRVYYRRTIWCTGVDICTVNIYRIGGVPAFDDVVFIRLAVIVTVVRVTVVGSVSATIVAIRHMSMAQF